MLIKANYLCGSKTLYNKFTNSVSRFIYPASFTISPIEQIKKLKSNIEQKNKSDDNIKLVSGGIRNIEFSLQALQLLNGGKYLDIRTGNSLIAMDKLSNKNILSKEEANNFKSAYTLYRKAEHYLQLMNDLQTHTIPADGELAEKLSHFLKFKDLKSFKEYLKNCKENVQSIYNSIVGIIASEETKIDFDRISFNDSKRAKSNFDFLQSGKSLFDKKQFDNRTTTTFEKIENELYNFLNDSIDPDLILENFVRIIRNAHFPKIWYKEFLDNKFFMLFLILCERSQKSIDLFAEDKFLRDIFLSRDSLTPIDKSIWSILTLKDFYFRTSVQLCADIIAPNKFSKLYTEYLNHKIISITQNFIDDKNWKDDFFIAAMGSFGTGELSFASDVDLIFVVENINEYPAIQKDFQNLLRNFRIDLPGLEIDCQLRPEGKSSQLVWDIEDYKRYFSNRARVWELQAFTKCRFIFGEIKLYNNFYNYYIRTVKEKDESLIKKEMIEMRKKLYPISDSSFNIKKGSGGLIDIDFIISFLFLTNSDLLIERKKLSAENSFYLLNQTSNEDINIEQLESNFLTLKRIELFNQLVFNNKLSKIPTERLKIKKLSIMCGFSETDLFLKNLYELQEQTRIIYKNIFN